MLDFKGGLAKYKKIIRGLLKYPSREPPTLKSNLKF